MFEVGQMVTWESVSAGVSKEKTGEVVVIVECAESPRSRRILRRLTGEEFIFPASPGLPRDRESYLVAVAEGRTAKAKRRLYWPRVNNLRSVG